MLLTLLLRLDNSDFAGAYIHNFYKENQKMTLSVFTGEGITQEVTNQNTEIIKTSCPNSSSLHFNA